MTVKVVLREQIPTPDTHAALLTTRYFDFFVTRDVLKFALALVTGSLEKGLRQTSGKTCNTGHATKNSQPKKIPLVHGRNALLHLMCMTVTVSSVLCVNLVDAG